jgi:3-oxoadipate enol-lactonase
VARVALHHRVEGPGWAPPLLLSASLGTGVGLWEAQVPALAARFRVVRYDARGHGRSPVVPGPCSIADLGRDVLGLADELGLGRFAFCGLSIGGMVGQWLALEAPERLSRVVLANTAACIGTPAGWEARIAAVRQGGLAAVAEGTMARWFTPAFAARAPAEVERLRRMLLATPAEGYAASCAAIRDLDLRERVGAIRVPVLVITGTADTSTPPEEGRWLAGRIPGARLVELEAAHLSNVEAAGAFDQAVLDFLGESSQDTKDGRST